MPTGSGCRLNISCSGFSVASAAKHPIPPIVAMPVGVLANSTALSKKLGVSAVAVSSGGNQGTNYTRAPEISFAGTGLQQDNHVCSMVGGAAAITNSAAIGTAAGTITVTA